MYKPNNKFKPHKRNPNWIVTFADLMALLLAFFVMLFSFSSMDTEKYKEVSEAMEEAFTVELSKQAQSLLDIKEHQPAPPRDSIIRLMFTKYAEDNLQQEIKQGLVEINAENGRTVIRFPEKVTFPSGSAILNQQSIPLIRKVGKILSESKGIVMVSGHSDDQPIHTDKYNSNWELSSSRAASVVRTLLDTQLLAPDKFIIQGYAETKPIKPNDTPQNRAINRRVEIIVDNTVVKLK